MSYVEIHRDDPAYPPNLRCVESPPERLYCDGDVSLLTRRRVSIIGSRQPSNYGIIQAYQAAKALAGQGVVIVSGMARGLDARAHRGALDAEGGTTIAVLGAGIDFAQPTATMDLLLETRRRGLVVSELPPGTEPRPYHFPARNRIIAALAECLLVVEGEVRGGTSNTVAWAHDLLEKEDMFGVPGRLDDPLAGSPNLVIREGGSIYTHPNDILFRLGMPTLPEGQVAVEAAERRARARQAAEARTALSGAEAALFDLIGQEPLHVDALAAKSALDPAVLLAALSALELQGLVTQLPGKHFALAA